MSQPKAFLGPDVRDLGATWIDPSARLFGAVEIGAGASVDVDTREALEGAGGVLQD